MNVTDEDIEKAVAEGAEDWEGLQNMTKIGTVCGNCKGEAEMLLHQFLHLK
jgi:nitrogen fixation NifU-like protein